MAEAETDVSKYLEKEATSLQVRFANWLQEEVGYNPNNAKNKMEAFTEGVRLATATRMVFQASDYNRNARAEEQAAAEEKPAPAPKPAKAAPPARKAAKKAAPPVETVEPETEETTPASPAKAAKAPARRAPARRSTTTKAADAPF